MTPRLQDVYQRCAVAAFDRQLRLADLVGGLDWHLDVPEARLSFGGRYRWAVQFLGTESGSDGTWLWAWRNRSGLPRRGLFGSLALWEAGQRAAVPEFAESQLPLAEVDGHALAAVASVLRNSNAYYRCPYDGGALFVLIQDTWYPRAEIDPVERIAAVFPQAVATLPLSDHWAAWASYLTSYGLAAFAEGDTLVTVRDGVPVLRATFDARNRLTHLEARVG